MIGFIVGAISGVIQYLLLSKFTGSATKGKTKKRTALFALAQFSLPFAVLVGVAFILPDDLMFSAIGIGSALIISAIVKYVITSRAAK